MFEEFSLFKKINLGYKNLPKESGEKNLDLEKDINSFLKRLEKIKKLTQNYIEFISFSLENKKTLKDKKIQTSYKEFNDKIAGNYIKLIELAKKINNKDFPLNNLESENKENLLKAISSFFEVCKSKEKFEKTKINNEDFFLKKGVSFSDYKKFNEINILASKLRINHKIEFNLDQPCFSSSNQNLNSSFFNKKGKPKKI
jgi:hypothetical protein